MAETFKDFSASALSLVETLLAIDPDERRTATAALNSEFFTTKPYACEPSCLPQYPPSKEMDAKLRDEKARRQRRVDGKGNGNVTRRTHIHHRRSRAVPAPEANAELQVNLDRQRMMTCVNVTSKSERFPPPHQDGAVGFPLDDPRNGTTSFMVADASFDSSFFEARENCGGALPGKNTARRKSADKEEHQSAPSHALMRSLRPSSIGLLMDLRRNTRIHGRTKGKELQVFGAGA
ncbi:putative serine/threonine-protein kinase [Cocos nucifera]|nr:putative serine/threonine-protein kinase [Cocos nucifera]